MILVVLAAGMGSRYGGLKQMDAFGAGGESLLDYSVFDAVRAGFDKVVFVIRQGIKNDFEHTVLARLGSSVKYELAFQEMDTLVPPEITTRVKRTKPWGTAHALLCASGAIDAPFTVINADDFYGRQAFAAMGNFLKNNPDTGALVPYPVAKTLSSEGTVARAFCHIKDGYLTAIEEMVGIAPEGDTLFNTWADGTKQVLSPDTPISMNVWGFPPTVFPDMKRYFEDFLAATQDLSRSECYLPSFIDWLIHNHLCNFRALEADSEWFGVTYQGDRENARTRIAALIASGEYPARLWGPKTQFA
jgi:hypothetical protein